MNPKVLIITKVDKILIKALHEKGYHIEEDFNISQVSMSEKISQFEGIITSTRIKFDQSLLKKAVALKWIARMGSGMEHIDQQFAKERGIKCFSSPEGNANAVAEQALGMYLCLQHLIPKTNEELKKDIWLREENRGREIEYKIAGIIGMGSNGFLLAQKLSLLGVKVLGFDKYRKGYGTQFITECKDLEEIYKHATMVSFHVPYTAETHHYFNHAFLAHMNHPFTLLNLSRGEVVDMKALYEGMQSGKIISAALDVWEKEPITAMEEPMYKMAHKLLQMPNFIGSAHIGGYTHEAIYKMSKIIVEKLSEEVLTSE